MNTQRWFAAALTGAAVLSAAHDCPADPPPAAPIASAPYVWRGVKVGAGGFIPGIVFSRVEKGLAYLRSDMGGCYRWDEGAKSWIPLQDAMGESSYFGGESIAPDPADANTVYVATGMYRNDPAAILRSHDRGRTWDVFSVPWKMGGNEDGRGLGERLAVDPNDTAILYFGSRHDGLQRSADHGETWSKVTSFPLAGRGAPPDWNHPTNAGLSFVVFDPASSSRGTACKTIVVASADPGDHHLFRSDDTGQTWNPVGGEPRADFLPAKGELDDRGVLYITYGNGPGPNGVTDGGVFTYDLRSGKWADITPDKRPDRPRGGYCGLSLDRHHAGTLAVSTMNRWGPVDTVWRSTDGGSTWKDIVAGSQRDVSATPFLLWGQKQAKLGWWMAALAIDPFDSNHAAYATGATVYATEDFANVSAGKPTHWFPWVEGIEQTAVITVMSPSEGAHLLSGFGDISGFVHDDLEKSPPQGMYDHPMFGNTNTLDYAEGRPNVIVRSGNPHDKQADLAWSEDGGHTWKPLTIPENARPAASGSRRRGGQHPAIVTSADGATFMVMTDPPLFTRNRGKSWTAVRGLPTGARPVPDRVDGSRFYALDFPTGRLFLSSDGGATFTQSPSQGLPADISSDATTWHEAAWPLMATFSKAGDLWLVSKQGLFHSSDSGVHFGKCPPELKVEMLSFGKAPAGRDDPALFAVGTLGRLRAVFRSDDAGNTWVRINDDQHQYGTRFRCIAGDPRVFGRVYLGTDGRGILYADPAPPASQR